MTTQTNWQGEPKPKKKKGNLFLKILKIVAQTVVTIVTLGNRSEVVGYDVEKH